MARNFREKNKFLYDVQHESASYFMDRMIKLLDEADGMFNAGTTPLDSTEYLRAQIKASGIPGYMLDVKGDIKPEFLKTASITTGLNDGNAKIFINSPDSSTDGYSISVDKQYIAPAMNMISGGNAENLHASGRADLNQPVSYTQSSLADIRANSEPTGEGWWDKLSAAWNENPSLRYGSYGALAAAGLVGAYYLYKKWQEKGSVDENDKAVAAKLDAENEK